MKILVVVSRFPWPPRRGDQLRTIQTVQSLATEHRVTVLAPAPASDLGSPHPPELPEGCELVTYRPPSFTGKGFGIARSAWNGLPLQSGLYDSRDLRRRVRELAGGVDLVMVQLARLAALGDELVAMDARIPLVVDLIDSLSLNVTRRALLDRRWLGLFLATEARRLAKTERRLIEIAGRTVLVSPRDREWLLRRGKLDAAEAEKLAVVPLAVEAAPEEGRDRRGSEASRPVLALTGNLGYFVNADAVLWWLDEVWPELSRRRPDLRLVVAGARPPRRVRQAVAASGAELIASPPDLRAVLADATVALAPLRGGSGVPVKVLEAWAVGVPVVASPWAAAGTGGKAGEELLVAETPEEWIGSVLSLVDDPQRRRKLSEAGRRRLALDHSTQRVEAAWRAVIGAVSSEI